MASVLKKSSRYSTLKYAHITIFCRAYSAISAKQVRMYLAGQSVSCSFSLWIILIMLNGNTILRNNVWIPKFKHRVP